MTMLDNAEIQCRVNESLTSDTRYNDIKICLDVADSISENVRCRLQIKAWK